MEVAQTQQPISNSIAASKSKTAPATMDHASAPSHFSWTNHFCGSGAAKLGTQSSSQDWRNTSPSKLVIGQAGNALEREADAVASDFVEGNHSPASRGHMGTPFHIQRKQMPTAPVAASNAGAAGTHAAPHFENILRTQQGNGIQLDAATRQQMTHRFGVDLPAVTIHNDAQAATLSRSINARAFTHGTDIYFDGGEYDPQSVAGQRLLAHELTHVMQQSGMVMRHPRHHRPAPVTRAVFDQTMASLYGVTVRTGTLDDQRQHFTIPSADPNPFPNWSAWDPDIGGQPELYSEILQAYANFAAAFGGTPTPVSNLVFFRTYYARQADGTFRELPYTGGLTTNNQIQIFSTATHVSNPNATARSRPGRSRGGSWDPGEAATNLPSGRTAFRENMEHELGHGLQQAIRAGESTTVSMTTDIAQRYNRAVGWASDFQLYDIGVPAVQADIAAGRVPPAQYHITSANWNQGNWVEQPMTPYMADNSGDDFAEAVRVYLAHPAVLRSRSPTRYAFIHALHTTHPTGLRSPTPTPSHP